MEKIIDEIEKIKRVEYARGYQDGLLAQKHFEEQFEKVAKAVAEETAQEKRDRIVEQAKADVEELKEDGIYKIYRGFKNDIYKGRWDPYSNFGGCVGEFIVNKEKRTVVVLMKGTYSGELYAKGIAKCAPSDCFNEYIGKAIALRRALGLKVPKDYLNAPNPTEVRVGNVVDTNSYFGGMVVSEVLRLHDDKINIETYDKLAGTRIIDDSVSIKEGTEC